VASRGRFIAFIDINPFDANAEDELTFWKGKRGVSGIKLHLGAAGFHASSPEQVARLANFFAEARVAGLPLVVHLRGGGEFPKAEVETFIAKVLPQASGLPVQIAHGGGYGGADPATIDSLSAFGDAIARKAPGTENLVFDISGIVLPDETAKALGSNDAQLKAFVGVMRKIGLNRFVVGSDWPALGPIAPYYASMRQKLPLTHAEWKQLWRNDAPYLRKDQ
jgi:predicted TIM-barrel fold metal-dependent hydrolase